MVNLVSINGDGHKAGRPITNRQQYFAIRNTAANMENFSKARSGDDAAKRRLVQFNYNDQLPDGLLAGCCTAASTFSLDIDCRGEKECRQIAQRILQAKEQLGLLELTVSPNWGLHPVCRRVQGKTILENQIRFSMLTQTEMDCNAHDQQRVMFTGPATEDVLLYLDDNIFVEPLSVEEGKQEYLHLKQREERGEEQLPANYKKGEKHYRPWVQVTPAASPTTPSAVATDTKEQDLPLVFGHQVEDFVRVLLPNGAPVGSRHKTGVRLASDLIIMRDGNADAVRADMLQLDFIKAIVRERGEKELESMLASARKLMEKRESEYISSPQPSKDMRRAIEQVTGISYRSLVTAAHKQLTGGNLADASADELMKFLLNLARDIKRLMPRYPLLELLCQGLKPKHYVAALFVGGAYAMTLMTRCHYSFYGAPGRKCRLNCLLELIGRMGSGKHLLVDLYKIMMAPVKKEDQAQIDALNNWNRQQVQNSGAAKNNSPRPTGIYRCLPCETSAAAIRDQMFFNHETINGEDIQLHVSIMDSELDNSLTQMKKDYLDISKLWLKAFHSEPQGAFLKTSSACVGEVNVVANFMYSGTEYALAKQVTVDNYGTGLPGRLTVVPIGDTNFEMMDNHQYTQEDERRDELISQWAEKLNKTRGLIPADDISNALYQWTSNRMAEAKENKSKAEEDLLKRVGWHAMNFSLPFIVSRHWAQLEQDDNGYWLCSETFATDKYDRQLAVLIAKAQLAFQHYSFKAIAEQYYERMDSKLLAGKNYQSHTARAYSQLPAVFTTDDVNRCYGYEGNKNSIYSCLKRLQDDGKAQRIRAGQDKGKYRKLD